MVAQTWLNMYGQGSAASSSRCTPPEWWHSQVSQWPPVASSEMSEKKCSPRFVVMLSCPFLARRRKWAQHSATHLQINEWHCDYMSVFTHLSKSKSYKWNANHFLLTHVISSHYLMAPGSKEANEWLKPCHSQSGANSRLCSLDRNRSWTARSAWDQSTQKCISSETRTRTEQNSIKY